MRNRKNLETWMPLRRSNLLPKTEAELMEQSAVFDIDIVRLRELHAEGAQAEWYLNNLYTVSLRRYDDDFVHLSIRRNDRAPARDWRHMQRIKNELLGEECEAVELYPAESRLVDTSNQFHLWGSCNPTFRFPFGFDDGRSVTDHEAGGSKQRPTGETK